MGSFKQKMEIGILHNNLNEWEEKTKLRTLMESLEFKSELSHLNDCIREWEEELYAFELQDEHQD